MAIRLKITGGYGGPATWQDLRLDLSSLSAAEFESARAVLEKYVGKQMANQFESASNIPDGRNYDFEIDEGAGKKTLSLNDASLPPDVAGVIQLMFKHSSKASHGRPEGETTKDEG